MALCLSQVTAPAEKMAPCHIMTQMSEKGRGGCSWENDDLSSLSKRVTRVECEEHRNTLFMQALLLGEPAEISINQHKTHRESSPSLKVRMKNVTAAWH